jgi:hypothetical protein
MRFYHSLSRSGKLLAGALFALLASGVLLLIVRPFLSSEAPVATPAEPVPASVRKPAASGMNDDPRRRLAELQARMSESAAGSVQTSSSGKTQATLPPGASTPAAMAAQASSVTREREKLRKDSDIKQRKLKEIQANALTEILAVPPGDTKKIIAVMERFDEQFRAAGAPPVLDMPKLKKTLEAADRIQSVNKLLIAESSKGKAADLGKINGLSQEIMRLQSEMPKQFYNMDELRKVVH